MLNRNSRILIILIVGVIFLVGFFLTYQNIELKKNLEELESPTINRNSDKQINIPGQSNANVKIVRNGEKGLWDKDGKKKITLVHELTIGGEQEKDIKKIFYRAYPIKADSEGNIYVAETWTDKTIKKFDANGNYLLTIGGKGQGPGEFYGFFSFFIGNDMILYAIDPGTQRITRFNCRQGNFLYSYALQKKQLPTEFSGVLRDNSDNFYISFFDPETDKVIHKFGSNGRYLKSFGMPIDVRNPDAYISRSIKRNNSRGSIVLFNKKLFYSQSNPYEIRKYNMDGSLEMVIIRKNAFMPSDKVEILGEDGYGFTVPAHSTLVGIWQNLIINCIYIPSHISQRIKIGSVIDIFNPEGKLLTSIFLNDNVYFTCLSEKGKLYGNAISHTKGEKIVRYALKIENK